jgi:chromate transporter
LVNEQVVAAEVQAERPQISLWTILLAYLQIGFNAFGLAILQKLKALVMDNHWLSEEEMNEGLGLVQPYPGPIMAASAH